jgi:Fe-S oxidoreductase
MAKMKAEFLFRYHEMHGFPLRDRIFGFIGKINRLSSPFAAAVNAFNKNFLTKKILATIGIAPQRELPALARIRFSHWVQQRKTAVGSNPVVLFNDTFTEFNEPNIGMAAIHVLESLGYHPIVPKWQCCGRTLISKGFLRQAKKYASTLVASLLSYAEQNIPIIGLEPSCLVAIKDDFQGLLGYDHQALKKVISQCTTFDEFLAKHIENNKLPFQLINSPTQIRLHGHCHQKALIGTSPTLSVLRALFDGTVLEIPTGCCGMAGSFGYEKEHYDFSVKIAEKQLVPALKNLPQDTAVVANGFSCRHQIMHLTERRPLHLAELIFQSSLGKSI